MHSSQNIKPLNGEFKGFGKMKVLINKRIQYECMLL